jgi:hypothetical protein
MPGERFSAADRSVDIAQPDPLGWEREMRSAGCSRSRNDKTRGRKLSKQPPNDDGVRIDAPCDMVRLEARTLAACQQREHVNRHRKLTIGRHSVTIIVTDEFSVNEKDAKHFASRLDP